jgi:hypothetical protein
MKPGSREQAPTVAEAVREAAAVCDPEGADRGVRAMVEIFEDDDRPATAVEDLPGKLAAAVRTVDPESDGRAGATARAAVWLTTNPGQAGDRERVLREAARLSLP